jgi:hypothetical protein
LHDNPLGYNQLGGSPDAHNEIDRDLSNRHRRDKRTVWERAPVISSSRLSGDVTVNPKSVKAFAMSIANCLTKVR